jgi:hypothetical protein
MSFTADTIASLIVCKKVVTNAPAREFKEENRHRRKDMELKGPAGEQFAVFIRQSLEFVEDFSIGLLYHQDGKRILLVRYNGQHDQTSDPLKVSDLHFQYHVHRATPENLNNGRFEKHSATEEATYASFDEALIAFLDDTNVNEDDIARHFPQHIAMPLFQTREGPTT